jgi:hypothetical protein
LKVVKAAGEQELQEAAMAAMTQLEERLVEWADLTLDLV